jgi:hypothetical protein
VRITAQPGEKPPEKSSANSTSCNSPFSSPEPLYYHSHLLENSSPTHVSSCWLPSTAVYPNPLFLSTSQKQLHYRQRFSAARLASKLHKPTPTFTKKKKKPDLTQTNQTPITVTLLPPRGASEHVLHYSCTTTHPQNYNKNKTTKMHRLQSAQLTTTTTIIISCWSSSQTDPAVRRSQVRLFE